MILTISTISVLANIQGLRSPLHAGFSLIISTALILTLTYPLRYELGTYEASCTKEKKIDGSVRRYGR